LTTQAIKAAQRRLGDKPDGQMTPALYKQLLAAKSLPAKKTTATPAKQAAAKATPKPVVTHIVEKRMSAIESARSQMEAANVAVGLPPPMSTQTAMSDQDCEQALMAILADMSDDELAELAQAAEDAQNEAGGGY
jgi:hypothetical protein